MGAIGVKSVLLRLEGPQQSWGVSSRFDERDTALEPTKSGVVGLCAAALGIGRDDVDRLRPLAALRLAVRVDRPGTLARDFQTAGGGRFAGDDYGVRKASGGKGDTVISRRAYLADASFLAALGGDDHDLLDRIDAALRSPHWPLFLGRRSFVPVTGVAAGLVDLDPIAALERAARHPRSARGPLRLVVEVAEGGLPRNDQPLSFVSNDRRFASRLVEDRELQLPES
jgi:CRISPR system Cascade subunit CasD